LAKEILTIIAWDNGSKRVSCHPDEYKESARIILFPKRKLEYHDDGWDWTRELIAKGEPK
jgi:hypothetical protein